MSACFNIFAFFFWIASIDFGGEFPMLDDEKVGGGDGVRES